MSEEGGEKKLPLAAIEDSREGNESIPVSAQPRQPRNFQDLLRYSTEASNAVGETSVDNSIEPLSNESKMFLEEVLKSMTVDVVEELMKLIRTLEKASLIPENGDFSECEDALDQIFDLVDNLDVANDFYQLGGFCAITPCLDSTHSGLRWRGAELVAELCQNNPFCQSRVLEMNILPTLLQMVDSDVNDTVRVKALYAVSCLIRENNEGIQEFIKNDGFSVLLRALQTDLQKLIIKSAFLSSCLCHWKPQIKDDLIKMGYVEQLISQLGTRVQINCERHHPSIEYLLSAILSLVRDHTPGLEIARKPELEFKSLLDYILRNSEGDDQYKEEHEHARDLIRVVFDECDNSDEER